MLFSHVINPFAAPPESEAARTQRITFAAIRRAVAEAATHGIEVEVLGAIFPEDTSAIEPPVRSLPLLGRRISELGPFPGAQYPLCGDILRVGGEQGTGDYLIFTNMDICPQPYFYRALARMIGGRSDAALVIPRRTISARWTDPAQLDAMCAESGIAHEGFDCFVFPRSWVKKLDLGNTCVGIPFFDISLIQNLDAIGGFRAELLWHQFLTFHLGDDKTWKGKQELSEFNLREAKEAAARLAAEYGPVPSRSRFEYASVWLDNGTPPPARLGVRVLRRVQQVIAEWRTRWLVRGFRRVVGLTDW